MRPVLLIALSFLAACAGGAPRAGDPPTARAPEPVDPEFQPALEALRLAVLEGEDELAERMLASVLARDPDGRALELALGFQRVLTGRRLVRSLELALRAVPVGASPYRYRLVLTARHTCADPLVVRVPPPSLVRVVTGLDPLGTESTRMQTQLVDALAELELAPDETLRVDLGTHEAPLAGVIALRDRWRLEFRSGEVYVDGEPYPAAELAAEPWEGVFVTPVFPPEPVEPAELVRYVQRERIAMPPLLERAVRIAPERRGEALALLEPVVRGLPEERRVAIAPAVRWLARTDPDAAERAEPQGLDLPASPDEEQE